ncbi:MAG TPA: transcription antitermination factor NusB [Pyrinomonadaceae bacterium]|nr:transcription antitermination factor NusB [Pyrinomonadaceae bacterium]
MSLEKVEKSSGTRHKARECALQMLFASDLVHNDCETLVASYWKELGDTAIDDKTREFANRLACGTLNNVEAIDELIRTRAQHWRIERMAIVDRNVLRLAVFEFLHQDTPNGVAINEALEVARRFSTYEATQFINGILDAIRLDIEGDGAAPEVQEKSQASSS